MQPEKNTIIITLNYEGKIFQIPARRGEYDSLMCLISDHVCRPGFGVCYGSGCCKTCGVIIIEKNTAIKQFALSCEIRIDNEIANKMVIL